MKCKETIEMQKEFIKTLLLELLKEKLEDIDANIIIGFCEDVLWFLENKTEEEFETN